MRESRQLSFEVIAIKGNTGYASAYEYNGLYEINLKTEECSFIGLFDEPITQYRIHYSSIWIKDKVFFIPSLGKNIAVFNTNDRSITSIPVPIPAGKENKYYEAGYKFIDVTQRGNNLWLIPSTYPGIICLNADTFEMQIFDQWIPEKGFAFWSKICEEGNSILIPDGISNTVLKYNLTNNSAQFINVGMGNNGVAAMSKIGADYYLAPRLPGMVEAWNPSSNQTIEYIAYPKDFKHGDYVFSDVYSYSGKVYLAPMQANYGLYLENGVLYKDENEWRKKEDSIIFKMFETSTHIYYHEFGSDWYTRGFKINKSDNTISETEFHVINPIEEDRAALKRICDTKEVVYDDGMYDIRDMLLAIG